MYTVAFIFVYIAALRMAPAPIATGHEASFAGVVEEVRTTAKSQRAIVRVDSVDGIATVNSPRLGLTVTDLSPTLQRGMKIQVRSRPYGTDRYSGIPGMEGEHIQSVASRLSASAVTGTKSITVTGLDAGIIYSLDGIRRRLAESIYSSSLSPEAASLLAATCLGGADLAPDTKEAFRLTGLSHLLCVSGFHVGVIACLASLLLLPLRPFRRDTIRRLLLIAIVWLYAGIVGFTPSVVRAAIMFSVYLTARITERGAMPLNSLCVAFFIMLAINPYQLFSIGFQLSFCAVAGILVFARRLNPVSERRHRLYTAVALVTVPVAALLGTAPVILAWFNRLPFATIALNAVATLVFPAFMTCGAVAGMLESFGVPQGVPTRLTDYIYTGIDGLLSYAAPLSAKYSITAMPSGTMPLLIALSVVLFAIALHKRNRHRRLIAGTVALTIAVLSGCTSTRKESSFIIDGTERASHIYAASYNSACRIILHGNGDTFHIARQFFGSRGLDSDSIVDIAESNTFGNIKRGRTAINISGKNIVLLHASMMPQQLPGQAILFVDHKFKAPLSPYLKASKPQVVVIAASVDEKLAELYSQTCSAAGTQCIDLHDSVFYCETR